MQSVSFFVTLFARYKKFYLDMWIVKFETSIDVIVG
jgi:hypothetical protein